MPRLGSKLSPSVFASWQLRNAIIVLCRDQDWNLVRERDLRLQDVETRYSSGIETILLILQLTLRADLTDSSCTPMRVVIQEHLIELDARRRDDLVDDIAKMNNNSLSRVKSAERICETIRPPAKMICVASNRKLRALNSVNCVRHWSAAGAGRGRHSPPETRIGVLSIRHRIDRAAESRRASRLETFGAFDLLREPLDISDCCLERGQDRLVQRETSGRRAGFKPPVSASSDGSSTPAKSTSTKRRPESFRMGKKRRSG